jgi:hypothetical protein
MDSPISDRREAVKVAAQFSSVIAGTVIAASSFRAALDRIFAVESHRFWLGPVILSLIAGILWFLLMLAFGVLGTIPKPVSVSCTKEQRGRYFGVSFALGLAVALILAVSACLALEANDDLFYSRSLPWIPSLIWIQEAGFRTASRLFPCRYEGFDTGCEAYKTLPAFLLANVIAYVPFSLATVFLIRYWESARSFLKPLSSPVLRWGSAIGVALLCIRLVLYRFSPDVSSPIAPSGVGRTAWLLLEWTLGPVSIAVALSIPFVFYGAICAVWRRKYISERLVVLTHLAVFVLAALILGNQYQ